MLLKLPTEVFLSILAFLDFDDKLSLNSTCKKLHDMISKMILYERLDLIDFGADAKNIIQRFESKEFNGEQVKDLRVDLETLPKDMVPRLSSIFPNVTSFQVKDYKSYQYYYTDETPEPAATWVNTLEVLNTNTTWYPMWYALRNHVFPCLTELEIEEDEEDGMVPIYDEGFKAFTLFLYLNNVPSLRKLSIKHMDITLDTLEDLHRTSPHLKSLKLESVIINVEFDVLCYPIVPATSVLHLEIDTAICFDENGIVLEYILKKYPNLVHLGFSVQLSEDSVVERLDSCYPGSYRYYPNSEREEDEEEEAEEEEEEEEEDDDVVFGKREYEELFSCFRSANEIYRNSLETFYSSLPKTVKSLRIDVDVFDKSIENVSKCDLNLVRLDIENLESYSKGTSDKSDQLTYLKNITTLKTLEMSIHSSRQISGEEFVLPSVTKLVLGVKDTTLRMGTLFSTFPSLEDLFMTGYRSEIISEDDETDSEIRIYPNLRKLTMKRICVRQGVFDYVKVAAPNVKDLELGIGSVPKTRDESEVHRLDVTGWKLEKCNLSVYIPFSLTEKSDCTITVENASRRLIFCSQDTIIFPSQGLTYGELGSVIHADIRCDNAKEIKIHGFPLKKVGDELLIIV